MVFDLLQDEGLCLGASSGVNVAGAVRLARQMGPGHTIVTVLCDIGTRYSSRLFNPEFLRERELPVPTWIAQVGGDGAAPPSSLVSEALGRSLLPTD
jgi:cysteine synthase A